MKRSCRWGALRTKVDALIVGGGLIGCAAAWHLALAGMEVMLVEQASTGSGASGQNAGSLHFQIERRFLERKGGLGLEGEQTATLSRIAIDDWSTLEDRLGVSLHVHMNGGLMVAENADQVAILKAKADRERAMGLSVETIDGAEARRRAPYLSEGIVAANFMAAEGHADTRKIAPAFATAATAAGAEIQIRTRLTKLEWQGASFRAEIIGSEGAFTVGAKKVLVAAGVWSARIAAMANLHLPLFPVGLTMSASERTPHFLPHLVQHVAQRLSMKQTEAGNILIGGGWPSRLHRVDGIFDLSRPAELIIQSLRNNLSVATKTVPRVADLNLIRTWTGVTAVTPDQLPIAGEFPTMPGLFCAAGGSAFTLGPTFARLVADQMLERERDEADRLLAVASPARFDSLNGFMGR
ncbi:FAD-dependent oxidoreductase [Qipengyuania algicida]|uniref:NAD(P)/FAD-dependent oxidoreductase n=1 Tax=Qipengyuania algicida TaxID=1836209 RepID=UPI00301CB2D2